MLEAEKEEGFKIGQRKRCNQGFVRVPKLSIGKIKAEGSHRTRSFILEV